MPWTCIISSILYFHEKSFIAIEATVLIILLTVIWAQFRPSRRTTTSINFIQKCDLPCCCNDLHQQSSSAPQYSSQNHPDIKNNQNQTKSALQRHLIIDGSNGPMHLHKQYLDLIEGKGRDDDQGDERYNGNLTMPGHRRSNNTDAQPLHHLITLLDVKDGTSQGDRIHVIPKLYGLLRGITCPQNHVENCRKCGIIEMILLFLGNIWKMNHGCDKGKLDDESLRGTRPIFENVTIYYDGLGKRDLADRTWRLSPNIDLKLTNITDEADDKIVEQVQDILNENMEDMSIHATKNRTQSRSVTSLFNLQDIIRSENSIHQHREGHNSDEDGIPINDRSYCSTSNNAPSTITSTPPLVLYTITRNMEGPGKSRKTLKHLRILREKSVLCLFSSGFGHSLQVNTSSTTKHLLPAERLIDSIEKRILDVDLDLDKDILIGTSRKMKDNIKFAVVVTDDVLLRQRVVGLGGYVMLFEQFWHLLSDVEKKSKS